MSNPLDNTIKYQYVSPDVPSGNTVTSSLASNPETTFTSQSTIPANLLSIGSVIKIHAAGLYGNGIASIPLTIKVKISGTVVATVSFTPLLNLTNRGWEFDVTGIVQSGPVLETQGFASFSTTSSATVDMDMENTSSISLDPTTNWDVILTAQWGALSLGGTITLRQLTIQVS